jgi:HEAT repeat protein
MAVCTCALAGTARASTRGFDTSGNPLQGLLLLLAIFFVMVAFAFFYLLLDGIELRIVDRMRRKNDVDILVKALRSSWLGPKAALALGRMGDDRAVEPLINSLCDRRETIRKAAAEALGRLGDDRAVEPLSHTLNDRYASVRDCAQQAIKRIKAHSNNSS